METLLTHIQTEQEEYNMQSTNRQPQLIATFCLAAFVSMTSIHAGKPNTLSDKEKQTGWKLLFDGKTMEGWNSWKTKQPLTPDKWKVEDGALTLTGKGGGDIYTADAFQNYELELEWKTTGNSGILIRVNPEKGGAIYSVAPEMQVNKGLGKSKTSTAALYDIYAVEGEPKMNENGWNHVKIRMVDGEGTHWFNGTKVYSYKIGSDRWNDRIANSKWKNAKNFGETEKGHIGFQDHGARVAYRNIRIREIK